MTAGAVTAVAPEAVAVLDAFRDAGVLAAADVHVARTIGRLCGEDDPAALLAAALAVRAPRLGHTCLDLATVRLTVAPEETADVVVEQLPWPDEQGWVEAVAASALVGADRPLRVAGSLVYLERHWNAEERVATALRERAGAEDPAVDEDALATGLAVLVDPHQRRAAELAVRRRLAVVAGGPGTGKTTTIAAVLGLLREQADARGVESPSVALVAPTGKAAQRVTESIADDAVAASTIHKLLGRRPDSATRFRHDRRHPLPHDIVVVDETSMVSLDLMAKLLDALRPDARLILVGDPDQLASVEAGAVLGDLVGPARDVAVGPLADHVVFLQRVRRYREDSGIAALAAAVQTADGTAVVAALERGAGDGAADGGAPDVTWVPVDAAAADAAALAPLRDAAVATGGRLVAAAAEGDVVGALQALDSFRILCAHRRGPYGVAAWIERVERWLAEDLDSFDGATEWYAGRPVLVTQNDYQLNLRNGDVGVAVRREDGRVAVAFPAAGPPRLIAPHRLEAVQTAHAMTIHKSQGSQLRHVGVVLPDPTSRILTRELLYTAVTRAQEALTLVGAPQSVTAAVARRVQRASGLAGRLAAGPTG